MATPGPLFRAPLTSPGTEEGLRGQGSQALSRHVSRYNKSDGGLLFSPPHFRGKEVGAQ